MEAKTHELKLWVLLIFRQQGESRKCHIPVKREEQMDGGLQILMVTLKQRELFCSSCTLEATQSLDLLAVGTLSSPTSLLCIPHPTCLDSQAAQPSGLGRTVRFSLVKNV